MQTAADYTNIAAYKFATLTDLRSLREELTAFCKERELKGTILLSPEGINLFVAGTPEPVEQLLTRLREIPGLETLTAKYSPSDHQPFNRMLVRLKKEIIAFGVAGIAPAERTSPKLQAKELKRWLDEGKEVILLDTRNDYEVKLGTFRGALPAGTTHFRQFPDAVAKLPEEMKSKPIVMFCTGGIRCEKAGPYMEREGFEQIYQLEGGILKYFEECGNAHYDGECFVFDQRVGVGADLEETASSQCFVCQEPLTEAELASPQFVAGKSCPHCYTPPEAEAATLLEKRRLRLSEVISPLPGSVPYDNYRPLRVKQEHAGKQLLSFLCDCFPHLPAEHWQTAIAQNKLLDEEKYPLRETTILRDGQKLLHLAPGAQEPEVNAEVELLHEDPALIVINKTAPLPMHPSGRYNRNTLQYILSLAYFPEKPKPAHRLDANTTGVVVFTRKNAFAQMVQPQFSRGEVRKKYLVKAQGKVAWQEYECHLPISEDYGKLGTRQIAEEAAEGQASHTSFRLLRHTDDGNSLLEAIPHTGRTNQIRLHLWALGHPILGDQTYIENGAIGSIQTIDKTAPPLCLHSLEITLAHPITGDLRTFCAPAPAWAH
jgi:UPF0176 protein